MENSNDKSNSEMDVLTPNATLGSGSVTNSCISDSLTANVQKDEIKSENVAQLKHDSSSDPSVEGEHVFKMPYPVLGLESSTNHGSNDLDDSTTPESTQIWEEEKSISISQVKFDFTVHCEDPFKSVLEYQASDQCINGSEVIYDQTSVSLAFVDEALLDESAVISENTHCKDPFASILDVSDNNSTNTEINCPAEICTVDVLSSGNIEPFAESVNQDKVGTEEESPNSESNDSRLYLHDVCLDEVFPTEDEQNSNNIGTSTHLVDIISEELGSTEEHHISDNNEIPAHPEDVNATEDQSMSNCIDTFAHPESVCEEASTTEEKYISDSILISTHPGEVVAAKDQLISDTSGHLEGVLSKEDISEYQHILNDIDRSTHVIDASTEVRSAEEHHNIDTFALPEEVSNLKSQRISDHIDTCDNGCLEEISTADEHHISGNIDTFARIEDVLPAEVGTRDEQHISVSINTPAHLEGVLHEEVSVTEEQCISVTSPEKLGFADNQHISHNFDTCPHSEEKLNIAENMDTSILPEDVLPVEIDTAKEEQISYNIGTSAYFDDVRPKEIGTTDQGQISVDISISAHQIDVLPADVKTIDELLISGNFDTSGEGSTTVEQHIIGDGNTSPSAEDAIHEEVNASNEIDILPAEDGTTDEKNTSCDHPEEVDTREEQHSSENTDPYVHSERVGSAEEQHIYEVDISVHEDVLPVDLGIEEEQPVSDAISTTAFTEEVGTGKDQSMSDSINASTHLEGVLTENVTTTKEHHISDNIDISAHPEDCSIAEEGHIPDNIEIPAQPEDCSSVKEQQHITENIDISAQPEDCSIAEEQHISHNIDIPAHPEDSSIAEEEHISHNIDITAQPEDCSSVEEQYISDNVHISAHPEGCSIAEELLISANIDILDQPDVCSSVDKQHISDNINISAHLEDCSIAEEEHIPDNIDIPPYPEACSIAEELLISDNIDISAQPDVCSSVDKQHISDNINISAHPEDCSIAEEEHIPDNIDIPTYPEACSIAEELLISDNIDISAHPEDGNIVEEEHIPDDIDIPAYPEGCSIAEELLISDNIDISAYLEDCSTVEGQCVSENTDCYAHSEQVSPVEDPHIPVDISVHEDVLPVDLSIEEEQPVSDAISTPAFTEEVGSAKDQSISDNINASSHLEGVLPENVRTTEEQHISNNIDISAHPEGCSIAEKQHIPDNIDIPATDNIKIPAHPEDCSTVEEPHISDNIDISAHPEDCSIAEEQCSSDNIGIPVHFEDRSSEEDQRQVYDNIDTYRNSEQVCLTVEQPITTPAHSVEVDTAKDQSISDNIGTSSHLEGVGTTETQLITNHIDISPHLEEVDNQHISENNATSTHIERVFSGEVSTTEDLHISEIYAHSKYIHPEEVGTADEQNVSENFDTSVRLEEVLLNEVGSADKVHISHNGSSPAYPKDVDSTEDQGISNNIDTSACPESPFHEEVGSADEHISNSIDTPLSKLAPETHVYTNTAAPDSGIPKDIHDTLECCEVNSSEGSLSSTLIYDSRGDQNISQPKFPEDSIVEAEETMLSDIGSFLMTDSCFKDTDLSTNTSYVEQLSLVLSNVSKVKDKYLSDLERTEVVAVLQEFKNQLSEVMEALKYETEKNKRRSVVYNLEEKCCEKDSSSEGVEQLESLNLKIKLLEAEKLKVFNDRDHLSEKLKEMDQKLENYTSLQNKYDSLITEHKDLGLRYENLRDSLEYQEKLLQMSSEENLILNDKLKMTINDFDIERSVMIDKSCMQKVEFDEQKKKLYECEQENESLSEENTALQAKLLQETQNCEVIRLENIKLEEETSRLKEELEKLQNCEETKIINLQLENDRLSKELINLQTSMKEEKFDLEKQNVLLRETLAAQEVKIDSLTRCQEALVKELNESKTKLDEEIQKNKLYQTENNSIKNNLVAESEKLKMELASFKTALESERNSKNELELERNYFIEKLSRQESKIEVFISENEKLLNELLEIKAKAESEKVLTGELQSQNNIFQGTILEQEAKIESMINQSEEWEKRRNELEREFRQLEEKLGKLRSEMDCVTSKNEKLNEEIARLMEASKESCGIQTRNDLLSEKIGQLEINIKLLSSENQELVQEVGNLKQVVGAERDLAEKLQKENDTFGRKFVDQETKIKSLEETLVKVKNEHQDVIKQREMEICNLKESLANKESEVATISGRLSNVEENFNTVQSKCDQFESNEVQLSEKLRQVEEEIKVKRELISTLQDLNKELMIESESNEQRLEEMKMNFNNQQSQIIKLQAKNDELLAQTETLKTTWNMEKKYLVDTNRKLSENVESLKKKLEYNQEMEKENIGLRTETEHLQSKIKNLTNAMSNYKEMTKRSDLLEEKLLVLKNESKVLSEQIVDWKQKEIAHSLTQNKLKLVEDECCALKTVNTSLLSSISNLKETVLSLKEQLFDLKKVEDNYIQREEKCSELILKNKALQKDLEMLKKAFDTETGVFLEIKNEHNSVKNNIGVVQKMFSVNDKLKEDFLCLSKKIGTLESSVANLNDVHKTFPEMENELCELRQKFSSIEKEKFLVSGELEKLKKQHESSNEGASILKIMKEYNLIPAELDPLEDCSEVIKGALENSKKELEEERERYQQLDEECDALNERISYLERQIETMYEKNEDELKRMSDELNERQIKCEYLTLTNKELQENINVMTSEIKDLKTKRRFSLDESVLSDGPGQKELKKIIESLKLDIVDKNSKITALELQLYKENSVYERKARDVADYKKKVAELKEKLRHAEETPCEKCEAEKAKGKVLDSDQTSKAPLQLCGLPSGVAQAQKIKEQEELVSKLERDKIVLKRLCSSRAQTIKDLKAQIQLSSPMRKSQSQGTDQLEEKYSALKCHCEVLKKQVDDFRKKSAEHTAALEKLKSVEEECHLLKSVNSSLSESVLNLKETVSTLKGELTHLKDIKESHECLDFLPLNENLTGFLKGLDGHLNDFKKNVVEMKGRCSTMKSSLGNTFNDKFTMKRDLSHQFDKLIQLEETIARLIEAYRTFSTTESKLKPNNGEGANKYGQSRQIDEFKKVLKTLPGYDIDLDKIDSFEDCFGVVERELKKSKKELEDEKEKCRRLDEECGGLNERISFLERQIEGSCERNQRDSRSTYLPGEPTLTELKETIESLRLDIVDKNSKITDLQIQLHRENSMFERKAQTVEEYKKKIDELKERLRIAQEKTCERCVGEVATEADRKLTQVPLQLRGLPGGVLQTQKIIKQGEITSKLEREKPVLKSFYPMRELRSNEPKTQLQFTSQSREPLKDLAMKENSEEVSGQFTKWAQ